MRSFFNKNLYKEGLKQTSLVAIIYFCVIEFAALLIPINSLSSANYQYQISGVISKVSVDGDSFNPLLYSAFCLFVPILGLVLFSFLNARNKSDFYHSIPHKRKTIFCSFTLSIITWLVLIFVVSTLSSFCVYFLNAKFFTVNFTSVLTFLFTNFSAAILVLGAGLIAVSVTGTVLSNIICAALILFFPRTLLSLLVSSIESSSFVVSEGGLGLLGDANYNLPFGFVTKQFIDYSRLNVFTVQKYGVYCLILGLIYIALAGILFSLRKSETSGNPALSKRVQAVIRIGISFFVASIGSSVLLRDESPIVVMGFYVSSIFVYFIYEIITRRSFRTVTKILPGLGVLVILNILFVVTSTVATQLILNVDWDVNRIESISFGYSENTYSQRPSYEDYMMNEAKIKDPATLAIVAENLTSNQEKIKKTHKNSRYENSLDNVIVRMKNGKTYHRRVFLSAESQMNLQKVLLTTDLKDSVFSSVPETPTTISVSSYSTRLDEQTAQQVYDTFKAEVRELGSEKWATYLFNKDVLSNSFYQYFPSGPASGSTYVIDNYLMNDKGGASIQISGYWNLKKYNSDYPITSYTPKTLALIFDLSNKVNLDNAKTALSIYETEGVTNYGSTEQPSEDVTGTYLRHIRIDAYDTKNNNFSDYYDDNNKFYENNKFSTALLKALEHTLTAGTTTVDITKPIAYISLDLEDYKVSDGEIIITNRKAVGYCFNFDDSLFPKSERRAE